MRIVLVDASRVVLKIITGLLEARGHTVHPFTDGPEALKYIDHNAYVDTLITCAELPCMSGLEMCWEARLLSTSRRPLYIILMSSDHNRHSLTEALDSGADDFIGKPPVAEELYARLRTAERHASTQRQLFTLATTDHLTGVLNRRAFFETAKEMLAGDASSIPVSAIMFDIDHFKRVNDVHGHAKGDEVISAVAQAAMAGAPIVGRLGGEEFAILLEGQPISDAVALADRLRLTIADLQFETNAEPLKITCSFGVSEGRPGENVDQILRRADMALYEAKKNGRNRVVATQSELASAPDEHWSGTIRSTTRETAPVASVSFPSEGMSRGSAF
jgi:two-component system cell cycle response regulator